MDKDNQSIRMFLKKYSLFCAWFVSLTATLSSLYMSEFLHYVPCELCWFQRIFMYPLVILLGMAMYKDDFSIASYALPFSIIGACFSMYHYLVQKVSFMQVYEPCRVGIPCSSDYLNVFGFITIPLIALIAFLLIAWFLWLSKRLNS